jgi:lipooligosaccharide transport system ATP-binding protein
MLRSEGATLTLKTHYMDEAAQLCDNLVIMEQGRIVRQGTPGALVEQEVGREVLELRAAPADMDALVAEAQAGPGVRAHEVDGDLVLFFSDDAEALHARLRAGSIATRLQSARSAGLEDVFLRLTGRRLRD